MESDDELRALADRLLETHRVEYVEEGVLLVMTPAGFTHRQIVGEIVSDFNYASALGRTELRWGLNSENFQWEFPDETRRFCIPDLTVVHPDAARDPEREQEGVVLIVEITSPRSPNTVFNDREVKPVHYAKGNVPFYLLVDQELQRWTLYGLAEGWPRYQIVSAGPYGEEILLPPPFDFPLPTDQWPPYKP
ncbi:Uma2 family endonuclease [Actinomadura hibisca]|uniref:Uma2 family endonuclease n=1 Tax=Actinomadura hibisca TaxID=68565 RepID=UPI00082FE6EE|nr:Uma2 family endonuclease [Actinomadura hibisca]